jgi:transcription elongation factor Elf1
MPIGFNLSYALTRFQEPILQSKPTEYGRPVICPHCHKKDNSAINLHGTTKCLECGMIYEVRRER